jgi:hypothetical protein
MLMMVVPVVIDIMVENKVEDWGKVYYPLIIEA